MSDNGTLEYIHQDHLSGTSLMTDTEGASLGIIKYMPYGETRAGDVPTDILFTGQRLDATGLYFYNARYYDPLIGRFISPDTIVPGPANPQSFNRYSYCLNNPLKFIDPSGHDVYINGMNVEWIDYYLEYMDLFWLEGSYEIYEETINSPIYQAYDIIRKTDDYYTEQFESTNIRVDIVESNDLSGFTIIKDMGNGQKEVYGTLAETQRVGDTITMKINNAVVEYLGVGDIVRQASHEFVHAHGDLLNPRIPNSKFEENLGDMYSYYICDKAGITYPQGIGYLASPNDFFALTTKYENTYYANYPTFPSDLNYINNLYRHIGDLDILK